MLARQSFCLSQNWGMLAIGTEGMGEPVDDHVQVDGLPVRCVQVV